MKNLLIFLLLFVSLATSAQKDVTKFLGIPVDGYKVEMKKKLIAKGFTYDAKNDMYKGEFNGRDVNVYVVTNNNKVWRIMICDKIPCGEGDIKIRFNNLCRQFSKNKKYISLLGENSDYTIPESEDISYKMLVDNKRYEASYLQLLEPSSMDTLTLQKVAREALLQEYTQEEISNPSEGQLEKMQSIAENAAANYIYELTRKKFVWFMISESYGQYYITMYYDNEYNHSDGEDL